MIREGILVTFVAVDIYKNVADRRRKRRASKHHPALRAQPVFMVVVMFSVVVIHKLISSITCSLIMLLKAMCLDTWLQEGHSSSTSSSAHRRCRLVPTMQRQKGQSW